MSHDPQDRRKQGRMAAMFTMVIVLVMIASLSGGGLWAAIPLAAVGLAIGSFYVVKGLRTGRTSH